MQGMSEPGRVLHENRAIETEVVAILGNRLLSCERPEERFGNVARHKMHADEDDE